MNEKEPLPQERHTNEELYRRQVGTLRLFLEKHAITQAQFDKSYHDLTEKMHPAVQPLKTNTNHAC